MGNAVLELLNRADQRCIATRHEPTHLVSILLLDHHALEGKHLKGEGQAPSGTTSLRDDLLARDEGLVDGTG